MNLRRNFDNQGIEKNWNESFYNVELISLDELLTESFLSNNTLESQK